MVSCILSSLATDNPPLLMPPGLRPTTSSGTRSGLSSVFLRRVVGPNLCQGECVPVRILEVRDLRAALERGDAPFVRDDRGAVVFLEDHASGGKNVHQALYILDVPARQRGGCSPGVIRRE